MISPPDPIRAQYPAASPAIEAATVLSRLAVCVGHHPGNHPSEQQRPAPPFVSRPAKIINKIPPVDPRSLAANRQRLSAPTAGSR